MGHSRQDGGFAEVPQVLLEGVPELPESVRAGLESLRPDFVPLPMFMPQKPPKPPKSEGGQRFQLVSEYEPKGD